ncbi:hypothetical protein ACFE04_006106 [Oxalis oulophora]
MESKRKRKGSISYTEEDDLELAKAAAMAWYHHGSGGEGKPISEFDIIKTTSTLVRPSRYKLEALRNKTNDESTTTTISPIIDYKTSTNSLLDKYEIESISKRLDDYIDHSNNGTSNLLKGLLVNDPNYYKNVPTKSTNNKNVGIVRSMKKKIMKLFWPRNVLVCGKRDDVDARAFCPATDKTSIP